MRLLRVSLVARLTARSLHENMQGVYCHLMSGHEISKLQHCQDCIMLVTLAQYTPDSVVTYTYAAEWRQRRPFVLLKAKSHYASLFEAGSELVRSWSPTGFEPASVMEFGF